MKNEVKKENNNDKRFRAFIKLMLWLIFIIFVFLLVVFSK